MRFFGRPIGRKSTDTLSGVDDRGSWRGWGVIGEAFSGAWQRNIEIRHDSVLSNTTIFACTTLIAGDISKLNWRILRHDVKNDLWTPDSSPAFNKLLTRPNGYQNHIQFKEQWILSKLSRGNTYVLKARDNRNVVTQLFILDPTRVKVLVATNGDVFYQCYSDNLTGLTQGETVTIPATEIIHDRFNCLFHPLVGLSPIFAAGLPAMLGNHMLENYAKFFRNGAQPSGILTAPGSISDETAARLKEQWDTNFTGQNVGKIAVLGDNLKFEQLVMSAVDAQVIDQLRYSDEKICGVYHVPAYKVGVGDAPNYNNIESLQQDYYSTCLQKLIEDFELCLDQGLALPDEIGIELDIDGLLRMDSATLVTTLSNGVKASLYAPNEGRRKLGLPPAPGGDSPLSQQQNYSLAALAKRDAQPNPFQSASPPAAPKPDDGSDDDNADDGAGNKTDANNSEAGKSQDKSGAFLLDLISSFDVEIDRHDA